MKTRIRLLPLVCLSAALVVGPSQCFGAFIEKTIDFSTYRDLPVILSGGCTVFWDNPYGDPQHVTQSYPAVVDSSGMRTPIGSSPGPGYAYFPGGARFTLQPNGPYLIGFSLVTAAYSPINPAQWSHPVLSETAGPSWTQSEWSQAFEYLPGGGHPLILADPGSYITSYSNFDYSDPGYHITKLYLYYVVPDSGSVFPLFLLTLISLLATHRMARVERRCRQ